MENNEVRDALPTGEAAYEVLSALFGRFVLAAQALGILSQDPTRDELLALASEMASRMWKDYEAFNAAHAAQQHEEATIVTE